MSPELKTFFTVLFIGLIAGYLASVFTGRKGMGIVGYIVVGVLGSIIGRFIYQLIASYPLITEFCLATAGSILLLSLVNVFASGKKSK